MTTFFTSDTHFGHAALIERGYRPAFSSVEEMDEIMIDRWNREVKPGDTIWHLGDFTLHGAKTANEYLKRLNGNIHLVWGNHDRNSVRKLARWKSSQYAADIKIDGVRVTLCHYAFRTWRKAHHGALMLHGHSHGNMPGSQQSHDVGVDVFGFRPVTLDEVRERMATLPSFRSEDHHITEESA